MATTLKPFSYILYLNPGFVNILSLYELQKAPSHALVFLRVKVNVQAFSFSDFYKIL